MKLWDLNDHDRSALAALEGRGEEMTAQTIAWSRINSGSWNAEGLRAQAGPIEARMRDVFDTVTAHESEGIEVVTARGDVTLAPTGPVFLSTLRPDAPVQVVFTGHYDTVFPPDAGFDEVTDLGGGKLNGPGLADMKGGITVLLAALEAVEATGAAKGIGYRFCLTPDEEIGNPISAPFLKQAATGAHVGLTYEPALEDGGFAGARKGSGNFSIIIKGISSHAGRAHEAGRSAILAAAELVVAIEGRNGHQGGVTFNTGKIDGGGPNNRCRTRRSCG